MFEYMASICLQNQFTKDHDLTVNLITEHLRLVLLTTSFLGEFMQSFEL